MKRYFLSLLLLISASGYAQQTVNNYKYVLVPEKFSFLKEENQYQLNSLSKMLLEEKGFTAYINDTEIPGEIASDKCKALSLAAEEKKNMFSTTLTLFLKDCKGNVLFKSKEGKSREKDYKASYQEALRLAFDSFNELKYAYTAPAEVTVQAPPAAAVTTPVPSAPAQTVSAATAAQAVEIEGTLYAQPTPNGYQLIDTTPKKVLTLLKTSSADYFIAENGPLHGIVFKKDGNWIFEAYKTQNQLSTEKLKIKF